MADQDPDDFRQRLTQSVELDPKHLDRALNGTLGGLFLDETSAYIHTPTKKADREALRSAMVLSADEDGQVNLLEMLENYPTQTVEIEGKKLAQTYRQVNRVMETGRELESWTDILSSTVRSLLK